METAANRIAECCLLQYKLLPPKGAKPAIRSDGKYEWTILAGVVIQLQEEFHCISLCTGVKTLPYKDLSPTGDRLHDSHAEVLARRGARSWLLKRLLGEVKAERGDLVVDGLPRLFQRMHSNARWRISPNVALHLYCSKFPCGDASSSSILQDRGNRGVEETIANQHVTLRGRSSLSDSRLHLRTKPGRPQSKPSISMSCTDKLSMWSVVGIQGSVLSRWIEPLFLSTLVIGVDHVLLQKGVTEELIRRCQTVLQDKIQHSPSVGRRIQVFPTALKFIDSRESVQERLLNLKPNAQIEGPSDELDLVPAAGSIVWIRGEKPENLIEGKRQGAALSKNKSLPLPTSSRSKLSKLDFYLLAIQASTVLTPQDLAWHKGTYFQAKNNLTNEFSSLYRLMKHQLRGSVTTKKQNRFVQDFLEAAQETTANGTPEIVDAESNNIDHTINSNPSSFRGWLVSGEEFESFDGQGNHCYSSQSLSI